MKAGEDTAGKTREDAIDYCVIHLRASTNCFRKALLLSSRSMTLRLSAMFSSSILILASDNVCSSLFKTSECMFSLEAVLDARGELRRESRAEESRSMSN